jgi:ribosomal protein S18 acetylase RimI-like enzyme
MPKTSDYHWSDNMLTIHASIVPWDSATFGFAVAQIAKLEVSVAAADTPGITTLLTWAALHDVRHISCRLPSDNVQEARLLEDHGFRFMEMVIQPYLSDIQMISIPSSPVRVEEALPVDLETIVRIAESAFGHERYHVDQHVPKVLADSRYGNWVRSAMASHGSQMVLKLVLHDQIVGFFIIEMEQDGSCYWHLTALDPLLHGRGIGTAAWHSVMTHLQRIGCDSVSTTVAVRNVRVINLYAKLAFRFRAPAMTFHWWSRSVKAFAP